MKQRLFLKMVLGGVFTINPICCNASNHTLFDDIAGFKTHQLNHISDAEQNKHAKTLIDARTFEKQKQTLKPASSRTYTPKPLPQTPEDIKQRSMEMIKQINISSLRPPEDTPVYNLLDPMMMRYIRHNTKPELDDNLQDTNNTINNHRQTRQKIIQEQGLLRLRIQDFEEIETLLSQPHIQIALEQDPSSENIATSTRSEITRLNLLRKKVCFSDDLKEASFLLSCMKQTLEDSDRSLLKLSQELIDLEKNRRVLQREISQLDMKTQRAFEARQKFYNKMQEGFALKTTPRPLEDDIYAFWYAQGQICLPEANDLPEIQGLTAKGFKVKMNLLKGVEIVPPPIKLSKQEKIDYINAKETLKRLCDEFGWQPLLPKTEEKQSYLPLTLADIDLKGSTILTASIIAYLEEPEDTVASQSSMPPALTWTDYFISFLKNKFSIKDDGLLENPPESKA